MSAIAIRSLAIARSVVGIALLAVPRTTGRIFLLPTIASSTVFLRLAGSRDLALGGLLWSASQSAPPSSSASADPQSPALRQALIAGAVVDAIDLISVGACFADGSLALEPAALVGGGAVVLLGMGLVGLQSWRIGRGGYTQLQ